MTAKLATLFIGFVLLFSCNNKKEKTETNKALDNFSNLKKIASEAEKIEESSTKLINAVPISKEILKQLLPESLIGMKRSSFSIGNQLLPDINTADATYKNDISEISFSIMDGAGETASAFISLASMSLITDFEKNDEYGYEKTILLGKLKAIEKSEKRNKKEKSELTTLIDHRFLIKLKGKNIAVNDLKKAFAQFDFSLLK